MNPRIYTVKEFAEILGVSDATIRNEIDRGKLHCFKVGNESRFTQHHVDSYMNIKNFGKTQRELELEQEKEELLKAIENKDKVIESIKNVLLKNV